MSKEVKLGLAIGGIFLSVILVYVLVVSGDPPATDQVALELPAPPVESTTGEQPAPPPLVQPEITQPPVAVDPPAPVVPEVPAQPEPQPEVAEARPDSGPDRWVTFLNEGMPVSTETPQPDPVQPPAGVVIQDPVDSDQFESTDVTPPARQPEPTGTVASDLPRTHVVQRGETYSSISSAVYGSSAYFAHLIRANPGIEPTKLRPGMVVQIPAPSSVRADRASRSEQPRSIDGRTEYRVEGGDSLYKISMKLYGKPDRIDAIYEANKSTIGDDKTRLRVGAVLKLPEAPTVASR
jgi:nucleoid-associated protein YgaU